MSVLKTISVAIIDDHPLIRHGLASAVADASESAGIRVLWTAGGISETLENLAKPPRPNLAIVDLSLGDDDGFELIGILKDRFPDVRLLVSTMLSESKYASVCQRAGASGFISKSEPVETLIKSITDIAAGGLSFSARSTAKLLGSSDDLMRSLSDRELQVMRLVGNGKSTKEIAEMLSRSPKTVETYKERIKQKLGISSAAELIRISTSWTIEEEFPRHRG